MYMCMPFPKVALYLYLLENIHFEISKLLILWFIEVKEAFICEHNLTIERSELTLSMTLITCQDIMSSISKLFFLHTFS